MLINDLKTRVKILYQVCMHTIYDAGDTILPEKQADNPHLTWQDYCLVIP
jgi:hypothetical protein